MYLDVDIAIQPRNGDSYPFSLRAPGGDADGLFVFPDDPAFQSLLTQLSRFDTNEESLAALGHTLFAALFTGHARDVLARTQGMCSDQQRLRLRLSIAAEEGKLAALPWELLADPDQGALALTATPIVRYLPIATKVPTVAATLPLKVLLSGVGTGGDVQPVLDEIQFALASLGPHAQVTVEPNLTLPLFQRRLREGFHVWHFVGQGGVHATNPTSSLLFSDGAQGVKSVGAAQLAVLLGGSGVRLVVLDASSGSRLATDPFRTLAPALMKTHIPTVIGMQFSLPAASQAFAGEFYRALAEGLLIDTCVTEGRRAVIGVAGLERPDWAMPVVYSRAPDNQLFAVPTADLPGRITTLTSQAGLPANSAVHVDSSHGTLLNAGAPPLVRRLAERPRPVRPPRSFFNRERELRALAAELQPRQGAWLRGPAGSGISALLRRVANGEAARAMADGVVSLHSAFEPADLSDTVQELFDRYYACTTPTKLTLDGAKSYLGGLQAVFIFDRLPLAATDFTELSDILAEGAVLIAAEGHAPDTLAEIALGPLPRQEATRMIGSEAGAEIDLTNVMFLDRICAALDDMPMALQLAGCLLQTQAVGLKQLVGLAEAQRAEPVALARAAGLSLQALDTVQTQVLAALVRGGPAGLRLDAVAAISQLEADACAAALERLGALRLSKAGSDRYSPATYSLGRVLDRMLAPGDQKRRAAAFFAGAAAVHAGNFDWLAAEAANLLQAIRTLLEHGQADQAGTLIKTLHPAAVLRGQWGLWSRLIDLADRAAVNNSGLSAWVQHERGSRAALLGDRTAAQSALTTAAQLRAAANDTVGAGFSQHNLRHTGLVPAPPAATHAAAPRTRPPQIFAVLGILLLVLLVGLLVYNSGLFASAASAPSATAQPVVAGIMTVQPTAQPPAASVVATEQPIAIPSPTVQAAPTALPIPTSVAPSPTEQTPICAITVAQINLRSGPSTVFGVLGVLSDGDQVAPLGRSADSQWLNVQTTQFGVGWLSSAPTLVRCSSDINLLAVLAAPVAPSATTRTRPSPVPPRRIPPTVRPTDTPTSPPTFEPTDTLPTPLLTVVPTIDTPSSETNAETPLQ